MICRIIYIVKYKVIIMIDIDNRAWPEYNAKLVRRGEFNLDLSCVNNYGRELKEMIKRKRRCVL